MHQRFIFSGFGFASLLLGFGLSACDSTEPTDDDDTGGATTGGTGGSAGSTVTGGTGAIGGTSATGGAAGSGTTTGGTGGAATGDMVPWDMDGWIDKGTNSLGIQGPWYAYNDCGDATPAGLPCTMPDMALMGPGASPAGWTASTSQICMKGTAAQVMMGADGMPAFSQQWGAGIAFDLNSTGGMPATISPFNAADAGISGFMFDITGSAPPTIRINLVMPTTPDSAHFAEIAVPATGATVSFLNCPDVLTCNIQQGSWVTSPTPFDRTQILTVQFQVFTNDQMPKPYDFCVSNFRVIRG